MPLIDRTLTSDDNILVITRAPIEQCIQQIVSDCDEAYSRLDKQLPSSQYGRANAIAALALKARALLYMASPLFNGGTAGKAGVPDLTAVRNDDGTRLFPDYDPARWQAAADAAKRCIDEALANGYGLYVAEDGDPVRTYRELFTRPYHREVLFARNNGADIFLTFSGYPRSQGGWGTLAVLQDLVDDYEMADGSTPILGYQPNGQPIINPASGYSEDDIFVDQPGRYHPAGVHIMFANREPRFYADINFQGQIGYNGDPLNFYAGEKDGYVPTSGENFTRTGYLQKRHVADGANPQTGSNPQHTWKYLRLGEVYLNYAEALNETLPAPNSEVYHYINQIRNRAGLPNLPDGLTKDEMRARIHHERRIELAFENHRFFDVRRWLEANSSQGGPVYGLNISSTVQTPFAFFRRTEVERRVFQDRHYLFPIPQDDINKNKGLDPAMFGKPNTELLDRLVRDSVTYFREREEIVRNKH